MNALLSVNFKKTKQKKHTNCTVLESAVSHP